MFYLSYTIFLYQKYLILTKHHWYLTYSRDGNPDFTCADESCANKSAGSKKKKIVVAVVVSVVVVVVLGSAVPLYFVFRKKRTSNSAGIKSTF